MSPSSSTVIRESNPRSPASVCAGLIASTGKAEIRATDARIVLAACGTSTFATGSGAEATTAGGGSSLGLGTAALGSSGSLTPRPASAAACSSSTFACCCSSATCSRNSATSGSIDASCAAGSRSGGGGLAGRSTAQYGCVSTGVGGSVKSRASRSSNSGAASTATPADHKVPIASASWANPSSSREASATFTGRSFSGSVAFTNAGSTPPAPTCTQIRAPTAAALRSAATKSTGAVAWRTQMSRTSPYTSPVIALTTAVRGSCSSTAATSWRIGSRTPSSSGEWNACDTSSFVTCTPAAASFCDASRTPAEVPEITVCFG